MNREEIEKRFDEKFPQENGKIFSGMQFEKCPCPACIKSFFFDEILPEILSDILPSGIKNNLQFTSGYNFAIMRFKDNAKEKYNITI